MSGYSTGQHRDKTFSCCRKFYWTALTQTIQSPCNTLSATNLSAGQSSATKIHLMKITLRVSFEWEPTHHPSTQIQAKTTGRRSLAGHSLVTQGLQNDKGKGILSLETSARKLSPTCHSMNQHWSEALFFPSLQKFIVEFLICKCPASQVPTSRLGALVSAEGEGWGPGRGRWLITSLSRNCVPTLHEFMKIPGTHSKQSVFSLSDSLGWPSLPPPPRQVLLGKECQSGP